MSRENAVKFDQQKTFSESYEPLLRFWLWLVYKVPRIIVVCDFSPSSFKLKRGIPPCYNKNV